MTTNTKCPCCSGKEYADCCEPIIKGTRKAATPEELMRSRYTAYAKAEIEHLIASTHPAQRENVNADDMRSWAKNSQWLGIEILKADPPKPEDETGYVEFIARYTDRGTPLEHHELSEFRKVDGEWFFYDGQLVKPQPYRAPKRIDRNAPCPCGSGKKYKKCCGK